MKGLKGCIAASFGAWLLLAGAAWAYDDVTPPTSIISTGDGAVLVPMLGDAVEGTSTDSQSGIFSVDVEFCSVLDPTACYYESDLGSDCTSGCPTEYAWRVAPPQDIPVGVYAVTVSAEDDAFNWEQDGPSITVVIVN